MEEIWKEVTKLVKKNGAEFYPFMYEVSNLGRVRTKKQRYGRPRKDTGKRVHLDTYRIVSGRPDPAGYIHIDLYDENSKCMKFRTHQIVIQTFVGYPEAGQVVCHYDDIKNNNMLSNLRYDTQSANLKDAARNAKLKA